MERGRRKREVRKRRRRRGREGGGEDGRGGWSVGGIICAFTLLCNSDLQVQQTKSG